MASPRNASREVTRRVTVVRPVSVGVNIPKLEAADKVTGRALYLDDIAVPGVLHGRTVRSTIARGRILGIHFDPAFDWSGFTIVDHRDVPGTNIVALIVGDQPILASDQIRHADEPVVLLAHADPERVEAGVRAVRIDVEPLEAVLTMEDSLAAGTLLYGDDNVFKHISIERGDLAAGFAASDLIVEGEYRCGHQEQLYIENNAMLAERTPEGGVSVRGSLQCPYYVHSALMQAFALPAEKVRVVQTVTGGGFGGKEDYPSILAAHAALLAWKSGKPVKIVYDRAEDMAATTKRHPSWSRIRAGAKRDGTLLALEHEVVMDGGAYVTLSPVVLSRGAIHAGGPYRWASSRIHARAVATNTPPNGAFRGFGAPQTLFAIECHMDRIAAELGIDPVELRRRNAVRLGDTTVTGQTLRESVGAHEVLERCAKRARWSDKRAKYARANAAAEAAERAGKVGKGARRTRKGIGFALIYHGSGFTGSGEVKLASRAAVDLTPEGRPRVLAASTEIGQGTVTLFSQIVGEALGVPAEFVLVQQPDTDCVPDSGPTVASRTCMVVGGLLSECAREIRAKLELFAEDSWADAPGFARVAKRFLKVRGPLHVEHGYKRPPEIIWDDETYQGDAYGCFGYAAIAVEVEVDLDTAETKVLHVTTSQDVGKAIHPVLCAGQIEGGTLQGLGWALLEELRWKDGRVWNNNLTNYIIPTSADTPPMDVDLVEMPYSRGPYGAKGVGEMPMDAPAPAVLAAIAQATGCTLAEIPATPERVLRAMQQVRS